MNYVNYLIFVYILKSVIMKGSTKRRIFGGSYVTNIREFPFMAFITLHVYDHYSIIPEKNDRFCTGTILNPKHILTAAHCTATCHMSGLTSESCSLTETKFLSVLTGNISPKNAKYRAGVTRVSVHPDFKSSDEENRCIFRYDISILELDIFLHFSSKIVSVYLPEPVNIKDSPMSTLHTKYKSCITLGWGTSAQGDAVKASERKLKKTRIQLIDYKECIDTMNQLNAYPDFENQGLCTDTSMCTYDRTRRTGICNGDSGGPLICNGTQVGVVSWSPTDADKRNCMAELIPDVYSRTDINAMWIKDIMANTLGVKRYIPTPINL